MLGVLVHMICYFKTAVMPAGRRHESRGQAEADFGNKGQHPSPARSQLSEAFCIGCPSLREAGRECAFEDEVCGASKVCLRLE